VNIKFKQLFVHLPRALHVIVRPIFNFVSNYTFLLILNTDCFLLVLPPVTGIPTELLDKYLIKEKIGMLFDPEDRDNTFLRNVGSHTDCTVIYPRRWQHSFKGTYHLYLQGRKSAEQETSV
jgi:hypothetical protein